MSPYEFFCAQATWAQINGNGSTSHGLDDEDAERLAHLADMMPSTLT